jgi:hypothetical protein
MTFSDYVAEKSIAVVGAAPLPYDQSAEIEGHDLVYRANLHRPGGWYGNRADIVFLNGWMGRQALDDDQSWWRSQADEATWWVFKQKNVYRPNGLWHRCARPDVKNPNAVTAMLWDLVQFPTGPITVFGTDLYSGGPEAAYYPGYDRHGLKVQAESFLNHLPFEQLRVHRQVVKTGKVVGDDRYLAAVNQTDAEYQTVIDRWKAALEEAT